MNNQMVLEIQSILDVLKVKVIVLEKFLFDEKIDDCNMPPESHCNDARINLLTAAIDNLNETRYILECIHE